MAYFELDDISFSYDESAEGNEAKKVIDGVSLGQIDACQDP